MDDALSLRDLPERALKRRNARLHALFRPHGEA
jgi:hypothetical protein